MMKAGHINQSDMEALLRTWKETLSSLDAPHSTHQVQLGTLPITLHCHNPEFTSLCETNFLNTRPKASAEPIRMHLGDARSLPFVTVAVFNHLLTTATARGDLAQYTTPDALIAVHRAAYTLSVWWKKENIGLYFTPDVRQMPYWNQGALLRTFFAWIADHAKMQLMHSGVLVHNNTALMLPGHGGSGKSSTVLHCLGDTFLTLGDDYVVVDPANLTVSGLYRTVKVALEEYNEQYADFCTLHATPEKQDKYIYALHDAKLATGAQPIKAIVLPRITHTNATTIQSAPKGEALRALAPTTLFQLPYAGNEALRRMSTLVQSVPSYWLNLGEERSSIPTAIKHFFYEQSNR